MALAKQLELPIYGRSSEEAAGTGSYRDRLSNLLSQSLDFHGEASGYSSHNFHSFPAKFPPQLPRRFIEALTAPGDVVLDPMAGSGTTVVEAFLAGRHGIGFDIDPLALLLCQVKTSPLEARKVAVAASTVLRYAYSVLQGKEVDSLQEFEKRFDPKTKAFIDYWFAPRTQAELSALVMAIEQVEDSSIRAFLQLTLSAVIITKSGGVSLARDLGHTRPHRDVDKVPRSAVAEFEKRLSRNLSSLKELGMGTGRVDIQCGDAQNLPLATESVDLIVTSPPYASNAIDYMRAHKFSLVWLGYPLGVLAQKRKEYIGGEAVSGILFEQLPPKAAEVVSAVAARDPKKGYALRRYYSEMTRCIQQMFRVLRPGKAAVIVVGTSTLRGLDTRTHECLADIGRIVGFDVVGIATRKLDRDRRMMPARDGGALASQIERRMHEEYVIGLYKPEV